MITEPEMGEGGFGVNLLLRLYCESSIVQTRLDCIFYAKRITDPNCTSLLVVRTAPKLRSWISFKKARQERKREKCFSRQKTASNQSSLKSPMGLNGLFAFYYDCHGDYKTEKQSIHSGINQILWKVEFSQNLKSLICSKAAKKYHSSLYCYAIQFPRPIQHLYSGGWWNWKAGKEMCIHWNSSNISDSLPFALIFLGLKPCFWLRWYLRW